MGHIYFDESKHPRGGFILGAFVIVTEDPDDAVARALTRHGLLPGRDEFKSGKHMSSHPNQAAVRDELVSYLEESCSLAVVLVPSGDEEALGTEALHHLPRILESCRKPENGIKVYFDQGLFPRGRATISAEDVGSRQCSVLIEQDSRRVLGIQLADVAAHSCSVMLLARLGLIVKKVNHQNPSTDEMFAAPIEWEYWYRLRRRFLAHPLDLSTLTAVTEPYGLRISRDCPMELAEAARETFGRIYVGCVW